jgi:hypothetical protein
MILIIHILNEFDLYFIINYNSLIILTFGNYLILYIFLNFIYFIFNYFD